MKGIEYTGAVIAVCGTCWLTAHIWLKSLECEALGACSYWVGYLQ
jgi:hypothetical protein